MGVATRNASSFVAVCVLAACAIISDAHFARAAQPATLDVPTPYLPSTRLDVEELLRLAAPGPQDVVVDLGSGDGRIVIDAAKYYGARGWGVDIDEKLVALANDNARAAGVADRVSFYHKDIFNTDLREATVVTMYLLSNLVNRLQPKLLAELKPGTRIIAHDYGFDAWKPDRTVKVIKTFYLYVVPARVAGRWELEVSMPDGAHKYEVDLRQQLQEISGGASVSGGFLPLYEARLSGERISFVISDRQRNYHFEGRVNGSQMEGTVKSGIGNAEAAGRWRALRTVVGGFGG
jgi:SAM-dependent methyltransferase